MEIAENYKKESGTGGKLLDKIILTSMYDMPVRLCGNSERAHNASEISRFTKSVKLVN